MSRPKILTAEFWARRIDAVTDGVRPASRAGAANVLLVLGQDAAGVDWIGSDPTRLAGAFFGGMVMWVLLTVAAPPRGM